MVAPGRERWHRPGRAQQRLRPASMAALPDRPLCAQTGDRAILDEPVPFLEGPPIPKGAEGINFVPRPSRDEASLYEHCCRAIDFTLGRIGPHGLPLIGSGDWNDGLSQFGEGGAGESVWLGFFLLRHADPLCRPCRVREGNARAGRTAIAPSSPALRARRHVARRPLSAADRRQRRRDLLVRRADGLLAGPLRSGRLRAWPPHGRGSAGWAGARPSGAAAHSLVR